MNTTKEYIMDKRLKDFYYDTLAAFGAYFPTEEDNIKERIADFCGIRFYIDRLTESDNRMDSIPFVEERDKNKEMEPSSYLEVKPFEFIQLLTRLYDSYHYVNDEWKNLESRYEEIKNHIFQRYYFEKYGYNTIENKLVADDVIEYRIHSLLKEMDESWDTYSLNLDCCNMKYQHSNLTCEFASDPEQHSYCGRFLGATKDGKPSVHQFHTIYSTDMDEEMNYLNQICNYQNLDTDRITVEYNYSGEERNLSISQISGDYGSTLQYDLTNGMVKSSQRFKNKETSSTHKATLNDKFAICQTLEKIVNQKNKIEYNEHVKGLKK